MSRLKYLRLLTYAALVAAFLLWPERNSVLPVFITSGSAEVDAEDAKPVRFLEMSQLKRLPSIIHTVKLPCRAQDFFAAINLDPNKANLPISSTSRSPFVVEQILVVPRDKDGWGCELVLFEEHTGERQLTVHRAEVWVTRSYYIGREHENIYVAQDSSYYLDSISSFLKMPNQ